MIKTLFETKLTDIKATDVEGVGTLRYEDDGNIYRWVKNEGSALTAKQPVCYDVSDVGTVALYQTVLTPVAADLMLAAGIAITAIGASGAVCYGWILAEGYFKDAIVTTPTTGGNDIEVGSEVVAVDGETFLAYQGNAATAPIYSNHFIALETVATATGAAVVSKDVYVKCL